MQNKLNIAWIPPTTSLSSASFRLRVAEIMMALSDRGHTCEFYDKCADPDILVVSKKYDFETQELIRIYRSNNKYGIIVFDLCDNHFFTDSKSQRDLIEHELRVSLLRNTLLQADAVTTSSEYLAGVVAENCDIDPRSIFTIDDCYESIQRTFRPYGVLNLLAEIQYKWLERRLHRTNKPEDRFVWFGTHGVSYAEGGMSDLLDRRKIISEAFQGGNRSLTIISNSYKKYREISSALNVKTYYLPWNKNTVDRALQLHTFLILPIRPTPFTLSKSTNRPVAAILNRLLVICDMIPSYENMREYLISPVSVGSLTDSLSMTEEERSSIVQRALERIHNEYSPTRIAERWESVFISIRSRKLESSM